MGISSSSFPLCHSKNPTCPNRFANILGRQKGQKKKAGGTDERGVCGVRINLLTIFDILMANSNSSSPSSSVVLIGGYLIPCTKWHMTGS
jgi:hypothetical protein